MKKDYYTCECGKEFDDPQKFNGHKRHCFIHLSRYGKVEAIKNLDKSVRQKGLETKKQRKKDRENQEYELWLSEKHLCKCCGKLMTKKYGSGKFCSRSCANHRKVSKKTKIKISEKLKKCKRNIEENSSHILSKKLQAEYYLDPKYCPICNAVIPYNIKSRSTCGKKECIHAYRSYKTSLAHKEGRNKGWISRNIISYPEKVWADILEKNNIKFISQFKVVNHKAKKYYFLDFLINDVIDLEIDGGQHKLKEAQKRDAERNIFVKSLGYKVYRIEWKGLHDNDLLKTQVEDLLKFIKEIQSMV